MARLAFFDAKIALKHLGYSALRNGRRTLSEGRPVFVFYDSRQPKVIDRVIKERLRSMFLSIDARTVREPTTDGVPSMTPRGAINSALPVVHQLARKAADGCAPMTPAFPYAVPSVCQPGATG